MKRGLVKTLELTIVHDKTKGDTLFPLDVNNINKDTKSNYYWKLKNNFFFKKENEISYSFVKYKIKYKINLINLFKKKIKCIFALFSRGIRNA